MSAETDPISLAMLTEGSGSFTSTLDAAADYWRARAGRLFPMYVLAMAPHAMAMGLLIDAIAGERRSAAARCCLYLLAATVWRWVWLSKLQQGVQEELIARPHRSLWKRLPRILAVRFYASALIWWGGMLVIPGFYGFFFASFAAPLLLENDAPVFRQVRDAVSWMNHSAKRLMRISLALFIGAMLLWLALFVTQEMFLHTLLPTLLGLDTADVSLTLESSAWLLTLCYLVFLLIDAYWSVAAVFVYYESQSRRMATDLRARLTMVEAA